MSGHLVYHVPRDYELSVLVFKLNQYSLSPSVPARVVCQDLETTPFKSLRAKRFEPVHVWKVRGVANVTTDLEKFLSDLGLEGMVGWFQAATGLGKSTWLLLKLASMSKIKVLAVSPFEQLIRFTGAYVRLNKHRKGFPDVNVRVHHLPIDYGRLSDVNYMSATTLLVSYLQRRRFLEDHGPFIIYVDEAHVDTPEYRCIKIAASSGLFGKIAVVFSTATPDGLPSAEMYRNSELSVESLPTLDINSEPSSILNITPISREKLTGKILVFAADHEHASRLYDYYKRQDMYVGKFDEQMSSSQLVEVLSEFSAETGTKMLITTFVLETGYTLDVEVVVDFSLKPDISYDPDKNLYTRRIRPVYPFEAIQRAGRVGRISSRAKVYQMKTGNVVDRGYGVLRLYRVYAWLSILGINSSLDEFVPVAKRFGRVTREKLWNVLCCALPPMLTLDYLDENGSPYESLVPHLLNFFPKGWKFDNVSLELPKYVLQGKFHKRLKGSEDTVVLPQSPDNYFVDVMVWFELTRDKQVDIRPIPPYGGDGLDKDLVSQVGSVKEKNGVDEEVVREGINRLPERVKSRVSFKPRVQSTISKFQVPNIEDSNSVLPPLVEERSPVLAEGNPNQGFTHQRSQSVPVVGQARKDVSEEFVQFQRPYYAVVDVRRIKHSFVFPYLPIKAIEDDYYKPSLKEVEVISDLVRGRIALGDSDTHVIETRFFSLIRCWNLTVVDYRQFDGRLEERWNKFKIRLSNKTPSGLLGKTLTVDRKGMRFSFEDLIFLFNAFASYGFCPCVPVGSYLSVFSKPVEWLTTMLSFRDVRVNRMSVSGVDETGALFTHLLDDSVLSALKDIHMVRSKTYVQSGFALGAMYYMGDYVYVLKHVVGGMPHLPEDDMVKWRRGQGTMEGVPEPVVRRPVVGERVAVISANVTLDPVMIVNYEGCSIPLGSACTVKSISRRRMHMTGRAEPGLSGSPVVAANDGALLGLLHGKDPPTGDLIVCLF